MDGLAVCGSEILREYAVLMDAYSMRLVSIMWIMRA